MDTLCFFFLPLGCQALCVTHYGDVKYSSKNSFFFLFLICCHNLQSLGGLYTHVHEYTLFNLKIFIFNLKYLNFQFKNIKFYCHFKIRCACVGAQALSRWAISSAPIYILKNNNYHPELGLQPYVSPEVRSNVFTNHWDQNMDIFEGVIFSPYSKIVWKRRIPIQPT